MSRFGYPAPPQVSQKTDFSRAQPIPAVNNVFGRPGVDKDKDKEMIRETVKFKDMKGYVGLLVRHEHALKFMDGSKTLEIRSFQLKFVKPGESIVLVSMDRGVRHALGILKFVRCFRIEDADFPNHFTAHGVDVGTYRSMTQKWKGHSGSCCAWEFTLSHAFQHPLRFKKKFPGTEVWFHFELDCVESEADRAWPAANWAQIFLKAVGTSVGQFSVDALCEEPLAPKPQHSIEN